MSSQRMKPGPRRRRSLAVCGLVATLALAMNGASASPSPDAPTHSEATVGIEAFYAAVEHILAVSSSDPAFSSIGVDLDHSTIFVRRIGAADSAPAEYSEEVSDEFEIVFEASGLSIAQRDVLAELGDAAMAEPDSIITGYSYGMDGGPFVVRSPTPALALERYGPAFQIYGEDAVEFAEDRPVVNLNRLDDSPPYKGGGWIKAANPTPPMDAISVAPVLAPGAM